MSDDHDHADNDYDNSHKAFLQAFLARSVMTLEEAKSILAKILTAHSDNRVPDDISNGDIQDYIGIINTAISPLDFEIRSTYRQTTSTPSTAPDAPTPSRTRVYALVNTVSDPATQLATTHTPDDIAFVKRVLDEMFERNNTPRREVLAVKGIDALRLRKPAASADGTQATTQVRLSSAVDLTTGTLADEGETPGAMTQGGAGAALTVDRAEKVLNGLVEEGWFEKSRAGYLTLSPRALMELRGWLYDTYNDPGADEDDGGERWTRIKDCEGCKDIVTVGQRCSNRDCLVRFHNFCAQGFFRNSAQKCPECGSDWTEQDFVGEKADKGMSSAASARRSSGH